MYSELYLDFVKRLDFILDHPSCIPALHYSDNSGLAVQLREIWRLRQQSKSEERDIENWMHDLFVSARRLD